ncbi:MAG TPA: hypothetical protein VK302_17480 [Terriglobales bacterium]|nr:hypothetical protein [Terriglobales bacterium]
MKSASASVSRLAVMLVILAMTPVSTVLMNGQEAEVKQAKGAPSDWTHQHLVFSNPGSADEAIRNGTYERWLKISTDPRYILQQKKRSANASSTALQHGSSQDASAAKPVALEPSAEQADARVQAREEGAGAIEMSLEEREAAQVGNRRLPSGLVRAIIPPPIKQADSPQATKKKKRNRIKKDWSETLGSNGTTGLGEFPAIFTTGGISCNDFAIFNTGLPGASGPGGQASIIAYNNLYSICNGGVPTVYWAYNTSGTVFNSVVLSYDGSQVAFVQSNSGGVASLVLLKWKAATGTLTVPAVPTLETAAAYNGCTASCMTTFTFSGSPNDSYSAPFVDYGTSTAYVGDDAGNLHKFTNIFASGVNTPAEATSPWPVKVNTNASLGSPVYDTGSTNVFVGDYLLSSSSACEPSATNSFSPCGYLYSVNSVGVVTKSAQLDFNFGIMDGPIVDPSAGEIYVFAGDDGSTSCTSSTPCAAVYQFPVGALASETKATVGPGYEFMMSGTFDNAYFTSSSSKPTGHLYVVGNTGPANNTLYQVSINANVMSTTSTAGPVVSTSYTNGYYAAGLQVAEFYDGTTAKDYIFLGVLAYGAFGSGFCGTATLGNGCVIGFDVTSGTITGSTTPTGATAEAGGTSGIVVDNGAAGAQNIYFSTLLNQVCTTSLGTGGCAIQTSQVAP